MFICVILKSVLNMQAFVLMSKYTKSFSLLKLIFFPFSICTLQFEGTNELTVNIFWIVSINLLLVFRKRERRVAENQPERSTNR